MERQRGPREDYDLKGEQRDEPRRHGNIMA
jgi:hypothetical protein